MRRIQEAGRREKKDFVMGTTTLLPQLSSLTLSLCSFLSFFSFASFFSLSLSLLFYFVAKATHKQLTTHILFLVFLLVSFYPLLFIHSLTQKPFSFAHYLTNNSLLLRRFFRLQNHAYNHISLTLINCSSVLLMFYNGFPSSCNCSKLIL